MQTLEIRDFFGYRDVPLKEALPKLYHVQQLLIEYGMTKNMLKVILRSDSFNEWYATLGEEPLGESDLESDEEEGDKNDKPNEDVEMQNRT